jgi:hypothetical protein
VSRQRNHIEPIGLAPVGLAIAVNGQRFDLVAHEPLTLRDGSTVPAMVWRAECAECGEGFTSRTIAGQFAGTRRCEKHRQPGKRVRAQSSTSPNVPSAFHTESEATDVPS